MNTNTNSISLKRYTTKVFDPSKKINKETWLLLQQVLRFSPSSTNAQPWHFFYADNDQGKAPIVKAMTTHTYNIPKVKDASHVVVLSARNEVSDQHLSAVLEKEDQDGRFATPKFKEDQHKGRFSYVEFHRNQKDAAIWTQKQVYLALGFLLSSAEVLGVDACPMEGFDNQVLDAELGLTARGFSSVVLVALGHSGADDFNAKLPKSRLPIDKIFTAL